MDKITEKYINDHKLMKGDMGSCFDNKRNIELACLYLGHTTDKLAVKLLQTIVDEQPDNSYAVLALDECKMWNE